MKVLVLCGLVALALASSPRWEQRRQPGQIRDQQFRAGREYRYAFDGQVSTGLPQTSQQHASTRVQTDVSILFRDQNTALLQLQRIRFGAANRDIEEPRQIQPFGFFDEQKLTEEQQQQLELPLRFRYQDGIVSDIEFDREDVAWSENIKRSVLNLIQVNLQKTGRTDQQETHLLREEEQESRRSKKFDFFTAPERTLEGNCDVSYTLTEQRESESREPTLFVQKSINFESCQERTDIRYNFRFGEQCNSCDKKFAQKERNLESTSVFNYNITGTPEQFLIREVEVRSQYVFAPLNEQENTISAYVTAKLQLIETTQEKSVEEPKSAKKQQPLLYSAEWDKQKEKFHMTGNQEFTKNTPYTDSKQKVEIVQKIVNQIVKEMSDDQKGIELEANHQMARLVKILRMANEEEINKIHREIFENTKQDQLQTEQVQDILANALAIAGTKHTIKHLMEKIQERQISPLKASYVLKALVNTRTVSEKHLELVHDLCKHQISKRNPVLRQSCWLTYGAMVNGMCAENQDQLALEQDEQLCNREQKQKYTKIIVDQFNQAQSRYEKVLALKTLANAGLDISVFDLEKIIRDRTEEKTVRMQAIDALRQLRSIMPRKIQNILMPIYKNKFEPADVRITAFAQIMHTMPERHILDQIVAQLEKERSLHVQAFVYSSFMTYANSTNPCEKQLSKDVQVSLRLARVQPQNIPMSMYKQLPIYSEQYKSGWTLNWGSLFANDSYLPKELSASLDTVLMGQWNKYVAQIGITQQNLDSVIARIYRKVQKEGLDEVVVRGKRASSSFRPTELLRNLFEKLSIKSRQNLDTEEPHALLYIRYKDLDYAILPLDEQTIPEAVKQAFRGGKLQLSEIERVLSQGYRFSTNVASFFYETSRKIPTALGMPLVINGKIPTVATIHGQISAELQPQNSEKLTGVKVRIQAQPQIASTHVTKMEIWNPVANTGLKMLHSVQANLPIDATVHVNVEKELKIKVVVKAPEMKKRIAVVQARPVTFVRSWPKNSRSYVEPKEKTVHSEQFDNQAQPIKREYGEETIGMKVSVNGHFHRQPFTSVEGQPLPILTGDNVLSMYVQPGKDTPREFVFEIEAEPFIETSEVPQPELKQFYSKKTQSRASSEELFDTESLENENQDEKERRQHYSRYVENYKSQKGYKHRLSLKAKATGSQTERRAETLIEAVCDERMRFCQLSVDAMRTPIHEESSKWTFTMKAQTLYPEQPKSLEQLKQQKHREFTGTISAKWGSEKKSSVEIQLQGEQNREQKEWLRRVERKQQGLFEEEELIAASHLNQYKAHIEYQIQPQTKNIINKVYQYVKSANYWNTEYELVDREDGQIQAQLTIDPETRRYVNVSISTPDEKIFIREARLPVRFGQNIRSQWQSTPVRSVHQLVKNVAKEQRAECSIKNSKINTFDDVIFKAPITTCYSVLAKDCSSSEPRFAVLAKKINKNSEEKKIKIIDEQNKIEIEYKNQDFQVVVNDNKVQEESQQEIHGIRQSGEVIVVELDDVVVHFDGYNVKIHLSQMYRSQQCGLCGHYDGERDDELRRADNELTDDLEDFHRSFLSEDEECEKDEEQLKNKKNYQLYESSESSSEEDQDQEEEEPRLHQQKQQRQRNPQQGDSRDSQEKETKKPVLRTKVIEYNHRICFSKEAVPECPRKSYPDEPTTEKKVKFACIERSHPEAQKLTRLSRKQVINVEAYPDSFVESLPVPQACVAY